MARVLTHETSLGKQLRSLEREGSWLPRLAAVECGIGGLLLIAGVVVRLWTPSTALLWIGGVLLFLGLAHRLRRREAAQETGRLRAGRSGELGVTRSLRDTLPDTCYILNDLNLKAANRRAQIDHLVVTPWGLFVLETKNWAGRVTGDNHAERWLQEKQRDGRTVKLKVGNPIRQNARHVDVLRTFLASHGVHWDDVHSLIVFPPKTLCDIEEPEADILTTRSVAEYIANHPRDREHSEGEVDTLLSALGAEKLARDAV